MDTVLDQMADIAGLRPVPWWPLAPGWWVLTAAGVVVLAVLGWWIMRQRRRRRGWWAEADAALRRLEAELTPDTVGPTASALSELLRRVALQSFTRETCAGLTGADWLRWLAAHDPRQFDWTVRGGILTDAAYAPPQAFTDPAPLRPLLAATRPWIDRGAA